MSKTNSKTKTDNLPATVSKRHAAYKGRPPAMAKSNSTFYRDEMVQILISQLNEIDPETSKAKKYLLIERLLAMGIGLKIRVNGRYIAYEPNLAAMKEILDRLIGRPAQAVTVAPDENKSGILIVFDEPGDKDL